MKPKKPALIPFHDNKGHVIRLPATMTLKELILLGFSDVRIVKPGTQLPDGYWRDGLPKAKKAKP